MPANREAIFIWGLTEGQVLTRGMDGEVFGVNQLAVWEAIDRYRVREPVKVFEKVLRLHAEVTMESMRKE